VTGEEVIISHDASSGKNGGFSFALTSLPAGFATTFSMC
jgi:hypothetical protein